MSLCFRADARCRLFEIGDPDQSIYSLMGVMPELLTSLAADDRAGAHRLRLNYRSQEPVTRLDEPCCPG